MEKTNKEQRLGCSRVRRTLTRVVSNVLIAIFLASSVSLANGIIYVDDDNVTGPWDGSSLHPYRQIQDGIDAAGSGSRIVIFPGLYTENVVIDNKDVEVVSSLEGDPNAASVTTIDGGQTGHAVRISASQVTLEGFELTNGLAANGGGLFCDSSQVNAFNLIVSSNRTPDGIDGAVGDPGDIGSSSGNGGGLFCLSSVLNMTGCEIRSNATGDGGRGGDGDPFVGGHGGRSGNGGGLYALYSTVEMDNCEIWDNATGAGGAGGDGDGFGGNGGISGAGGGVCGVDSDILLYDCELADNATGQGGGGGAGDFVIGGDTGNGGAVYCQGGTIAIEGCVLRNNASGDGGNAFSTGGLGGDSGRGAGLYVLDCEILDFAGCELIENTTGSGGMAAWPGGGGGYTGSGGGAYIHVEDSVTLEQCIFAGNRMGLGGGGEFGADGGSGGGLYCRSAVMVVLEGCDFVDNHAGDGSFGPEYGGPGGNGGGAVIASPCVAADGCRFLDNTAGDGYFIGGGHGGGLFCTDSAAVVNCLVANNASGGGDDADAAGNGGGLYADDVTLVNCTVSHNTVGADPPPIGFGGGVYAVNGAAVSSSLLWYNSAGGVYDEAAQVDAQTPVVNYSCVQGWTGTWGGVGNIGDDPVFAEPDRPDADYHLKSEYGRWDSLTGVWVYDDVTSPCIDAGDPADLHWKNELWPHGERINMGVYGGTPQASLSPLLRGNPADVTRDGCVGTDDLLRIVDRWLTAQTLLAEDVNLDGSVDGIDFAVLAENWGS